MKRTTQEMFILPPPYFQSNYHVPRNASTKGNPEPLCLYLGLWIGACQHRDAESEDRSCYPRGDSRCGRTMARVGPPTGGRQSMLVPCLKRNGKPRWVWGVVCWPYQKFSSCSILFIVSVQVSSHMTAKILNLPNFRKRSELPTTSHQVFASSCPTLLRICWGKTTRRTRSIWLSWTSTVRRALSTMRL